MKKTALIIGIVCFINAFYLGIKSSNESEPVYCVAVAFFSFIIGMLYLLIWKDENGNPST